MLLARLRGNLEDAARTVEARLYRDGVEVNAESLSAALILHLARVQPRSAIVPWHLPDKVVLKMIAVVAAELAGRFT